MAANVMVKMKMMMAERMKMMMGIMMLAMLGVMMDENKDNYSDMMNMIMM